MKLEKWALLDYPLKHINIPNSQNCITILNENIDILIRISYHYITCVHVMFYLHRYVRAEVIAGFVNALFLLFIAFFIFAEAIEVHLILYQLLQVAVT